MEKQVYLLWLDMTTGDKHNNRFELMDVYATKEAAQNELRKMMDTHYSWCLDGDLRANYEEHTEDEEGDPNGLYQIDLTASKDNVTIKICGFIERWEVK